MGEKKPIYYNKEELESYKESFPACAQYLQDYADNLVVMYNQMPFKGAQKIKLIQKIKRGLTFYNPNFEEQERIKKEEKERKRQEKIQDKFNNQAAAIFAPEGQAESFNNLQPLFYDKAGNWWLWNFRDFKWEIVDEVDILNMVHYTTGKDTISPKERTIILNSLKQEGRKRIPNKIKPTWIQFKDILFDVITGEKMKASPSYFVTNPLPYELNRNNDEKTPIMDKIFEDWVGLENIQLLYEIIAYCMLPDYPIHRLFCLIGAGMNGKSCFLRLLKKFIGEDNITSTELDTLLNSRFEVTRLFKKLVCIMGETNFNELSQTSILKKLTGQDLIGYEYKNKTPFNDLNYAKILIATNNLPTTTDKTIGFYRRWLIIDFPNQFSEKKDILDEIPEEEYEKLALKCTIILKDVLEARKFTNEGSVEDRMKKYEEKSNFFEKFWQENVTEDMDSFITVNDFEKKLTAFCRNNRQRMLSAQDIHKNMAEKSIVQGKTYVEWWENDKTIKRQVRAWSGIKWK